MISGGLPTWAGGLTAAITIAYLLQIAVIWSWSTPVDDVFAGIKNYANSVLRPNAGKKDCAISVIMSTLMFIIDVHYALPSLQLFCIGECVIMSIDTSV